MKSSKVLLAHPDAKVRETLTAIFEKSGHPVDLAADGDAAVKAFVKGQPDIVILNSLLGGAPPYVVFSRMKAANPGAKILVFSVQAGAEKAPRPVFGIRPFRPGELLDFVDALDSAQAGPLGVKALAPRVLVVDDDPAVRETLTRFLKQLGYDVHAAADGLDGLSKAKRLRPHLILLDIDMPKLDGVETLRRIREADASAGVLMVTGNATLEMMGRCQELGAFDYLLKPFDFEYLEFCVYSKILMMTW